MTVPLKRFEHGGDVYAHAGVIDFSASINPLGMPPKAADALCSHLADYEAYPDIECRALANALADALDVPARNIVCTAGASDLIARICSVVKPERALVTAPCFSGYEQALEQVGAHIMRHRLRDEEDFALTERVLSEELLSTSGDGQATGPSRTVLFLCNPNNPTGSTVDAALIERVVAEASDRHIVVVMDECFLEFTGEPSSTRLCAQYPDLIIMRAFTKMYAMAGLRLGYGICSDESLISGLKAAGQPWAVSTPAQVAGVAALSQEGWIEQSRAYVDRERAVLQEALSACGMRVIPSQANYLLFQCHHDLYEPLLQRGLLIRRCQNFQELDDSWYRIAVRTTQENQTLMAALKEVCR